MLSNPSTFAAKNLEPNGLNPTNTTSKREGFTIAVQEYG